MSAEKWFESSSGYLELIDLETNVVLAREKRRKPPRKQLGPRRPGRPSKEELATMAPGSMEPRRRLYEAAAISEKVFNALISGVHLKLIGPQHGCPPQSVIVRLRREDPEFAERIETALEVRASMRQDEAEERLMKLAEEAKKQGGVGAARLAVEIYKFLAELNDPPRYKLTSKRGRPKKNHPRVFLKLWGLEK